MIAGIEFNERVASMRPSATLAMTAASKARKREGHPVIGLSAGEPDFATPTPIADAGIKAIQDGFTHYTHNLGTLELREAISAKLQSRNGLGYDSDEIICSNGAKQSVALAISVLCRAGDEVIIPAPFWVSYPEMTRFAGGTPVPVQTGVESGYLLTAEQLEEAITEKTRIVILCSPSNPTGGVYSREQMEGLAAVLRNHPNIFVVSDEIYEHIIYDAEFVSFASLEGMKERTVTVNGFSKAYAMTGWRLGFMAAEKSIVKTASKLQGQLTSAPSSISQMAGIAALEMDGQIVRDMVASFKERRDLVHARLSSIEGIVCPLPQGAFYQFPDIGSYLGSTTASGRSINTSEDLCFYILEEHNVGLVPGQAFGGHTGIRISYAASMDDLNTACDRLEKAFSSLIRATE